MHGIGILGNCCTHGAGAAQQLRKHPKLRVVTGFEKNPRRGQELERAMEVPLARSYEEVVEHPDVEILAVTSDPCDKAGMVDLAASHGKAIFLNKPLCHSPSAARRIVNSVRRTGILAVFDIPMVKFIPAFQKLMGEVKAGVYGRVISYYHSFGMTFPQDFPIRDLWPERFDPPEKSGGGEMTNMGCYAIDYAVSLLGMPRAVQARWQKFWQPYRDSDIENYGQIILDYGSFWAFLAVGKQAVRGNKGPRNALAIEFECVNLFFDPGAQVLINNGHPGSIENYLAGYAAESPVNQLLRCLETRSKPESDVETGAAGVEVLCAAYQSILEERAVSLPLEKPANPLFEV